MAGLKLASTLLVLIVSLTSTPLNALPESRQNILNQNYRTLLHDFVLKMQKKGVPRYIGPNDFPRELLPNALYHWTSAEGWKWALKNNTPINHSDMPLKPIDREDKASLFPSLVKLPGRESTVSEAGLKLGPLGLFTSLHPLISTGHIADGGHYGGENPLLVELIPNLEANYCIVFTNFYKAKTVEVSPDCQIVLHIYYQEAPDANNLRNNLSYDLMEWIILDTPAGTKKPILRWSIDPNHYLNDLNNFLNYAKETAQHTGNYFEAPLVHGLTAGAEVYYSPDQNGLRNMTLEAGRPQENRKFIPKALIGRHFTPGSNFEIDDKAQSFEVEKATDKVLENFEGVEFEAILKVDSENLGQYYIVVTRSRPLDYSKFQVWKLVDGTAIQQNVAAPVQRSRQGYTKITLDVGGVEYQTNPSNPYAEYHNGFFKEKGVEFAVPVNSSSDDYLSFLSSKLSDCAFLLGN